MCWPYITIKTKRKMKHRDLKNCNEGCIKTKRLMCASLKRFIFRLQSWNSYHIILKILGTHGEKNLESGWNPCFEWQLGNAQGLNSYQWFPYAAMVCRRDNRDAAFAPFLDVVFSYLIQWRSVVQISAYRGH